MDMMKAGSEYSRLGSVDGSVMDNEGVGGGGGGYDSGGGGYDSSGGVGVKRGRTRSSSKVEEATAGADVSGDSTPPEIGGSAGGDCGDGSNNSDSGGSDSPRDEQSVLPPRSLRLVERPGVKGRNASSLEPTRSRSSPRDRSDRAGRNPKGRGAAYAAAYAEIDAADSARMTDAPTASSSSSNSSSSASPIAQAAPTPAAVPTAAAAVEPTVVLSSAAPPTSTAEPLPPAAAAVAAASGAAAGATSGLVNTGVAADGEKKLVTEAMEAANTSAPSGFTDLSGWYASQVIASSGHYSFNAPTAPVVTPPANSSALLDPSAPPLQGVVGESKAAMAQPVSAAASKLPAKFWPSWGTEIRAAEDRAAGPRGRAGGNQGEAAPASSQASADSLGSNGT